MSILTMNENDIQKIDSQIEPMMEWARTKKAEAEQLALDATRLMACTSERFDTLKRQGFFKRCWNRLSGKNADIATANINDLIQMQKIAFRYVNMLQERELLMAHTLLSLKNNLISLAVKDAETRELVDLLAKKTADRFEKLETRVDQLEITTNLQGWLLGLEEREYDEKYPTPYMRLFRVINDFYGLKNDNWNYNDIMFLRKAIRTVELNPKQKVSMNVFIENLTEEIQTDAVGFESYAQAITQFSPDIDNYSKFVIDNISSPVYVGIHGLKTQFMDRMDIVETLEEEMNISKNEALKMLLNKAISNLNVNMQHELYLHDIAIEILTSLRLANILINNKKNRELSENTAHIKYCELNEVNEKQEDTKVEIEAFTNMEGKNSDLFTAGDYTYDLANEEVNNWDVTQIKPKGQEEPEDIYHIVSFCEKFYILTEYTIYETEDFNTFKTVFDCRNNENLKSFNRNAKFVVFKNKLIAVDRTSFFLYTDDGKDWSIKKLPESFRFENFRDVFKFKDKIIFLGTKLTIYSYTVPGLIWDSRKETSCYKPIFLYGTNIFDFDINNIANEWGRYEYNPFDCHHIEVNDTIYVEITDCVDHTPMFIASKDCNTWVKANIPNNFIDEEYKNKMLKFLRWTNILEGFLKISGEEKSHNEINELYEEMIDPFKDTNGPELLSAFINVWINYFSRNKKYMVYWNKELIENKICFAPIIKHN